MRYTKPFVALITIINQSFNMNYDDAERYADWLKKSCLKEYRKELELNKYRTITREGK